MDVAQESYFAMQIAIKTLRERCLNLQERVSALEEENRTLKFRLKEGSLGSLNRTSTITNDILNERISLLGKEKEQLSQHLQLVSNENKSLWRRLSKITQAHHNLGSNVNKISEKLNKHELSQSQILTDSRKKLENEVLTQSLEESLLEVSSKLINGILLEKTELESQYAEMVDLNKDNDVILQNLQYSIHRDESSIINDINEHYEKLKKLKTTLINDKKKLQNILDAVKDFKAPMVCKCRPTNENESVTQNNVDRGETSVVYTQSSTIELANEANEDVETHPDKICPMCGEKFDVDFNKFADHVTNHFSDEDELVLNNFEFVQ